jgi:hypothetical protein
MGVNISILMLKDNGKVSKVLCRYISFDDEKRVAIHDESTHWYPGISLENYF